MVSAALVAQREVDEQAVAAAGPADGKSGTPLAEPGAGKARLPAEFDAIGIEPDAIECSTRCTLSAPSCRGLDQDILACRNCS